MPKYVKINKKIKPFNKIINIPGDKSISIRFILMAAIAVGKSKAYGLLKSEDCNAALKAVTKLGAKVKIVKNYTEINGLGINGLSFKNKTVINCQNSGTLMRLIGSLVCGIKNSIILIGDHSLSQRPIRVMEPLNLFGANIKSNKNKLPLEIEGTKFIRPIKYKETKGSAQIKSFCLISALSAPKNSISTIIAKRSRDHTEKLFKYLKIPIKIKKKGEYDFIEVKGGHQHNGFVQEIPGDMSSASFFICLTLLSKNSSIIIKNVNINKTRSGIIYLANKMCPSSIKFKNRKIKYGEEVADIYVKSAKSFKAINPNPLISSKAIDEYPLIFLLACKSNKTSWFKGIGELALKESNRLKVCANFLRQIGIKVIEKKDSLKISGNPKLKINKKIVIKNFMKDHRIFMMACIAALTFNGTGEWFINDKDSIKTSFPSFLNIIKKVGAKIN